MKKKTINKKMASIAAKRWMPYKYQYLHQVFIFEAEV